MRKSKYLIIGSSHAGLSAVAAIRIHDSEGSVTIVDAEDSLPYSPTILPYVISGQIELSDIFLHDEASLKILGVTYKPGEEIVKIDPSTHSVFTASGERFEYEKLLLATGARPLLPDIMGLKETPFHVLRSLSDALDLQKACLTGGSTIVVGAGLIGMHAAENLAKGGMKVTVIEKMEHILPSAFSQKTAELIAKEFIDQGVQIFTGQEIAIIGKSNGGCEVALSPGEALHGDRLLISIGVSPSIGYISGSGVELQEGILVDEKMRSATKDVWAAGDVAQAPDFFDTENKVKASLLNAVEQGRIAGSDMAGDPDLKPYKGGIMMNTYHFFGHSAFTIGLMAVPDQADETYEEKTVTINGQFLKLIFHRDNLVGSAGIDCSLDPGICVELIRNKVDMSKIKDKFVADPIGTGRLMMSKIWR